MQTSILNRTRKFLLALLYHIIFSATSTKDVIADSVVLLLLVTLVVLGAKKIGCKETHNIVASIKSTPILTNTIH